MFCNYTGQVQVFLVNNFLFNCFKATFYALLVKTEYAISLTLPKVNKLEFQGIIIELFLNKEKYKGPSQKNDFSTEGYSLQHISIHYKISIFTTSSLSYNHLFRKTWYSYPTKHNTKQMIQANVPVSYEVAVTISAWQWGHLVCTGLSRNCCTMATVGWATTTVVCPYCADVGCP